MKDALVKIRGQLWDIKNQLSRVPDGAFSARQMAGNVAAKLMDIMRGLDDLIEYGNLPEPKPKAKKQEQIEAKPEPKAPKAQKKQIYEVLGGNHGDR